jgi:DNA modification methylase
MTDAYRTFLESKVPFSASTGFEVDPTKINPALKPHCQAIVPWLLRGGRRALFASFGLQKTVIQLETVRLAAEHANGAGLIVLPLGVRQEFRRDAVERLGWAEPPRFIRSIEEADSTGVYLTNYETVRDGKLDPRHFAAASLDEAACLRGFGGTKIFREFMRLFAGDGKTLNERVRSQGVQYRFVATATPSPNDYIELLAYAAYLGIMDVSAAKTRFFKRNSEKADKLTIHPHKEREFWLWVSSWALFITKPSDLGPQFSDEGYDLPPLDVRWHEVPSDHSGAGTERDGQGRLFRNAALGVTDASREKRDSIDARVAKLVGILDADKAEQGRDAGVQGSVLREESGTSIEDPADSQSPELCGEPRQVRSAPEEESACVVRDHGERLSGHSRLAGSSLCDMREGPGIGEDVRGSRPRHGGDPWNPLQSVQPGTGTVSGERGTPDNCSGLSDQVVIWCDLNDEQRRIESALLSAGISCSSLFGSQTVEDRETLLGQWRARETAAFLSKPQMYGAGVNLQQSHTMIFLGISFKAQDIIQAVHRIHRFQQQHRCIVHFIYTEAERDIRRQLERKWAQHVEMVRKMTEIIREYGLSHAAMAQALTRSLGVERVEVLGDGFRLVNNDCVDETKRLAENSINLILTSIPFSTQYEYSPNYADFGHSDNNEHFFKQMDFLTPELLRALKPGRVAAIHVKDRIVPGGMTGLGFQTVYPFHARCIDHYTRHGFAYMGMKTIVTDVVRENNQTYRLGWTEQCKDGSKMGCGMPEYLLLFRKPPSDTSNSYADEPVVKSKKSYTRSRWQIDAHGFTRSSGNRPLTAEDLDNVPHDVIFKLFREFNLTNVYDFEHHVKLGEALEARGILPVTFMLLQPPSWHQDVWTDITRMLTLNGAQSAKGREMHLCPMQFDIADRVIAQFSMPGETVLDPFGGLMTVPYRAVLQKRFGIGFELSSRYFLDGAAYCHAAASEMAMPDLFALDDASRASEVA